MKKPSDRTLKRELRRLRNYIDRKNKNPTGGSEQDVIETRIAYAIEQAIRWARQETVGWERPLEDALSQARILERELRIARGEEA